MRTTTRQAEQVCPSQYFNAIVIAVVFVFCFVFMEETNYHRDTDSIVTEARNEADPTHDDDDDLPKPGAIQLQKVPASSHVVQADVRRKSFVQRLALWTRPRGSVLHNFRDGVLQPLQFLRLPIVWFCAIQYAFGQVYFNGESLSLSVSLGRNPSPADVVPCSDQCHHCANPLRSAVLVHDHADRPHLSRPHRHDDPFVRVTPSFAVSGYLS